MSHIALDLRMVGPTMHGIARYAVELARRLPRLAPSHRFSVLGGPDLPPGIFDGLAPPHPTVHRCRHRFLDPREQIELPWVLARVAPDLMHWTSFSVSPLAAAPSVITLHDANHLAFPEHFGPGRRLYYDGLLQPAVVRSRAVITVSHFAAGELVLRMGIPLERIAVIHNGIDPRFKPLPKEGAELSERLGLPKRFALYVGNTKAHKNLPMLIEAARRSGVMLVALVPEPLSGPSRVTWLTGLADRDLPALYSAATVFAFPSLYEGFGLPPLEAMACGTPVLVSDAASLPEVVGDGATVVPVADVAAWAEALNRAMREAPNFPQLSRGLGHAGSFTWDRAARETLAVYDAALTGRWTRPKPANSPPARYSE